MTPLLDGFRIAWRRAKRRPVSVTAIILISALAISFNAALATTVDRLFLRGIGLQDPSTLYAVGFRDSRAPGQFEPISASMIDDLQAKGFVRDIGVVAAAEVQQDPDASWLRLMAVSRGLFAELGVAPYLGRLFVADEDVTGRRPLILGYEAWRLQFGGDATLVGRVVTVAGQEWEVVGVMRPGFSVPFGTNMWTVWSPPDTNSARAFRSVVGIARLSGKPPADSRFEWKPIEEFLRPKDGVALALLTGIGAIVLGSMWLQLAALMVARTVERGGELATRVALGADGTALQLLFVGEVIAVAVTSSLVALPLTPLALRILLANLPQAVTSGIEKGMDLRSVLIALGIALVGAAICWLATAVFVARAFRSSLTARTREATLSPHRQRLKRAVVLVQLSATGALLYVTGLTISSARNLITEDPGFHPEAVASVPLITGVQSFADLRRRVEAMPGVHSVAGGVTRPLGGGGIRLPIGRPGTRDSVAGEMAIVTDRYFETLGIPMLAGRDFTGREEKSAVRTAIVNEKVAARLGGVTHVVGLTVSDIGGVPTTIVGVVGNARLIAPDQEAGYQVYFTSSQWGAPQFLFIRAADTNAAARILADLRALEGASTSSTKSLSGVLLGASLDRYLEPQRAQMLLMIAIGMIAAVSTGIGIFGALDDAIRQQRPQIAIRLALGASGRDAVQSVVSTTALLVAMALAIATLLGAALGRIGAASLYGVSPFDLRALVTLSAGILGVGLLAAIGPIRKALKVSPVEALRHE